MRYVHLPHGYDGISTNLQLQLARAAETLPGPIYVHCHHGKHRGPAAAAIICMANNGWSSDQAETWLVAAGTATNYAGLYQVVRQFQKPTAAQLRSISSDFPETAKVSGLVDAMVDIDNRWDYLKAIRAAAYQTLKEQSFFGNTTAKRNACPTPPITEPISFNASPRLKHKPKKPNVSCGHSLLNRNPTLACSWTGSLTQWGWVALPATKPIAIPRRKPPAGERSS